MPHSQYRPKRIHPHFISQGADLFQDNLSHFAFIACHAAGIPASLEVLQLDLGDLHSVRSVARQLSDRFRPRTAPRTLKTIACTAPHTPPQRPRAPRAFDTGRA